MLSQHSCTAEMVMLVQIVGIFYFCVHYVGRFVKLCSIVEHHSREVVEHHSREVVEHHSREVVEHHSREVVFVLE